MLDEMSISRILRQLRYLNSFAKKGMSAADWEAHRLSMGYTTFQETQLSEKREKVFNDSESESSVSAI